MQALHGVLDMLVLRTLLAQPMHGYGHRQGHPHVLHRQHVARVMGPVPDES